MNDVKRAAQRRLNRTQREERNNSVTSVQDLKKIDFFNKLNFLVERKAQHQSNLQSLETKECEPPTTAPDPVSNGTSSRSIPMRIVLKETSQERILKAHEKYSNEWNKQVEVRESRFDKFIENKNA